MLSCFALQLILVFRDSQRSLACQNECIKWNRGSGWCAIRILWHSTKYPVLLIKHHYPSGNNHKRISPLCVFQIVHEENDSGTLSHIAYHSRYFPAYRGVFAMVELIQRRRDLLGNNFYEWHHILVLSRNIHEVLWSIMVKLVDGHYHSRAIYHRSFSPEGRVHIHHN